MQKRVNLVDLGESFPTNIYLQNLASIQKRTSPIQFAHLAEKSEKGSISNLSTKARAPAGGEALHADGQGPRGRGRAEGRGRRGGDRHESGDGRDLRCPGRGSTAAVRGEEGSNSELDRIFV